MAADVLSVPEAAAHLHVSRERVLAMIRHGLIDAERVGSRWLIPTREVERRRRVAQHRGRPIQASTAWTAAVAEPLPPGETERDHFRRKLRPRAEHVEAFVHPSMLSDLRTDEAVVVSGREAADHHNVPAGADPGQLDAYIRRSRYEALRSRRAIDDTATTKNVCLHVVDDEVWPFEPHVRVVPLLVAWLDLADSGDRAESLVRDALLRTQQKSE